MERPIRVRRFVHPRRHRGAEDGVVPSETALTQDFFATSQIRPSAIRPYLFADSRA